MENSTDRKTREIADLTKRVKELDMLARSQRRFIQALYNSESWRVGHTIVRILKRVRFGSVLSRYYNIGRRKERFWSQHAYDVWKKAQELTTRDEERIKQEISHFSYNPLISILLIVTNETKAERERCIESVFNQLYGNWELCVVGTLSVPLTTLSVVGNGQYQNMIARYAYADKRIKVSTSIGEAVRSMSGEYVGFLQSPDALSPDALYENVKLLNHHPEADMIYSDEDEIDEKGERVCPHFKPDWSPDLLLSTMYIGSLALYRRELLADIIGFQNSVIPATPPWRGGSESSTMYDLTLRFTERTEEIFHIPKILYHKKTIPAKDAEKNREDTKKILKETLQRRNIAGEVLDGIVPGSFRVKRDIIGSPWVSIIIPTRDYSDVLKKCLDSIWQKTRYPYYEIIIVDNHSTDSKTVKYLESIRGTEGVRILQYNKPFNFSAINNFAVRHCGNEYVLFLNNDTEVISVDWLSALLEHAQRPEVGAVGCKLMYPNGTIQHAGLLIGSGGGIAGYVHKHFPGDHPGYRGRLGLIQEVSAVTAACLLMSQSVFEEVGGFNEEDLPVAYNDVDLCLRIRQKGYRIIYTPYAELYHHESLSREGEDTAEKYSRSLDEIHYMMREWGEVIDKGDPYYNPNFARGSENFFL